MGKKLSDVERHLVRGLAKGLAGHELYDFVAGRSEYFSIKRLKRASLAAMGSQPVSVHGVLEGVYSLAVYGARSSSHCH